MPLLFLSKIPPARGFRVGLRRGHTVNAVHSRAPSTLGQLTEGRFRSMATNSHDTEEKADENRNALEWESFDFGDSPKWDPRFQPEGSKGIENIFDDLSDDILEEETRRDELLAKQQREHRESLQGLSPQLVQDSLRILQPYVQDQRRDKITQVLKQRTRHTQFLFENPSNPSNVWACLRTMDSFGIQHVHIVTESELYQGKAALLQKQGMRTAMGSAQWLTIHHYVSAEEAIRTLRDDHNCRILASDLNPSSIDIRDIDWGRVGGEIHPNGDKENSGAQSQQTNDDDNDDRPLCIVMGNELRGISDTMRDMVDATFTLPMVGFAESFNLSVATAITLAHLSAASCHDDISGPLRPGDLEEDEFNALLLRGMVHSISQKRVTQALLKKEGIVLPDSMYQKSINLGKKLKE